jgi:hypothetical protein
MNTRALTFTAAMTVSALMIGFAIGLHFADTHPVATKLVPCIRTGELARLV